MTDLPSFERRTLLSAGTSMTALSAAAAVIGAGRVMGKEQSAGASLRGPIFDLTTGRGNVDAYLKLTSNLDMKSTHYGWIDGYVMGVAPGGAVRDICGFRGIGCNRLLPYDGPGYGYRRVLREIVFYTDLKTGEILEEMENPFTGEKVRVVPVANDPFNAVFRDVWPDPPSYGGLNQDKREPRPFLLNWQLIGGKLVMELHVHLYYPNALDPKVWVRESSGPMNRVSETFNYSLTLADLQNPELTTIESTGVWGRVTPWLPWMLMGQAEGHCLYNCNFASVKRPEDMPDQRIVEHIAKNYPKFLDAPTTWEEPSLSSLEWYARQQKPAPARSGS
ncbi:MAG: DUF1838 family protein [Rhodospirillaceae bacterium]|nr:DUF1838 family protein [Rhodospirillaceae bacterium]